MSKFMELYFCATCGWGERNGKEFDDFVDHVRNTHGVDVRMGWGDEGDPHFCYCNDCPRNKDGHGKHMCSTTSVMNHLEMAHGIEGEGWPAVGSEALPAQRRLNLLQAQRSPSFGCLSPAAAARLRGRVAGWPCSFP